MTKIETRNITLAKLKVSEANTRKTNIMVGHEQMLASIAAKGQLTPILVYPSDDIALLHHHRIPTPHPQAGSVVARGACE